MLIDGAHALGQLPLDLYSLGADYYVANCHKWLSGPRGSACMWVGRQRQAGIRPLVVSHGSGCGFVSDFIWDGELVVCASCFCMHVWRMRGASTCVCGACVGCVGCFNMCVWCVWCFCMHVVHVWCAPWPACACMHIPGLACMFLHGPLLCTGCQGG